MKRLFSLVLMLCLMTAAAFAQTEGDFSYFISNGQATITSYTGSASELTLPDTLGGCPVTAIRYCAFRNCPSLTKVVIPEGILVIGSRAFQNCPALTQIVFPQSIQRLDTHAFHGCCSLKQLLLPDHLARIHTLAFYGCSAVRYCRPDSQTAQTLRAAGLAFSDAADCMQQVP